jgi:hypothetical protein
VTEAARNGKKGVYTKPLNENQQLGAIQIGLFINRSWVMHTGDTTKDYSNLPSH